MKRARFSLRALFLFTSAMACFLALNQRYVASPPPNALVCYILPMPDRCLRLPHTIEYGWPSVARTDNLADHPKHHSGPCKFDSTYHTFGLTANFLIAIFASATITGMTICLLQYLEWCALLRRENRIVDGMTASRQYVTYYPTPSSRQHCGRWRWLPSLSLSTGLA